MGVFLQRRVQALGPTEGPLDVFDNVFGARRSAGTLYLALCALW
jgi:hypothetical protein